MLVRPLDHDIVYDLMLRQKIVRATLGPDRAVSDRLQGIAHIRHCR
jgi:hypothetical protein